MTEVFTCKHRDMSVHPSTHIKTQHEGAHLEPQLHRGMGAETDALSSSESYKIKMRKTDRTLATNLWPPCAEVHKDISACMHTCT